jgi:1-pyrroline-5-carboxylate dehydrogenase
MVEEIFGPVLTVCTSTKTPTWKVLKVVRQGERVCADRRGLRPGSQAVIGRSRTRCAAPPATSTSTTSRPGAVVGQQPFGGESGLGHQRQGGQLPEPDALGSPRSVKETFDPPKDYTYPHMAQK